MFHLTSFKIVGSKRLLFCPLCREVFQNNEWMCGVTVCVNFPSRLNSLIVANSCLVR